MRNAIILAAGLFAALTVAVPAQAQDADSRSFIKNAVEGNIAEIDAGKLASEKSKTPAVKEFGAMLVKDHGEARTKSEAVARAMNVDPPTGSSIMQKGTYAKLKVLQGDTFDSSFASSMVSDHEADIKAYEKISVKNDAVGKYAKETLPTLRHHLEMAQQLKQQLSSKSGTAK